MKAPKHIEENLALAAVGRLGRASFQELTDSIVQVLNGKSTTHHQAQYRYDGGLYLNSTAIPRT
jgi:hypothetical protein